MTNAVIIMKSYNSWPTKEKVLTQGRQDHIWHQVNLAEPFISHKDVEYLNSVHCTKGNNGEWKLIDKGDSSKQEDYISYQSIQARRFIKSGSDDDAPSQHSAAHIYKYCGVVNYALEHVLYTLIDPKYKCGYTVDNVSQLNYCQVQEKHVSGDKITKFSSTITLERLNMNNIFVNDRELCLSTSIIYESKRNRYYIIKKSVNPVHVLGSHLAQKVKESDCKRGYFLGGWIIEAKSETQTEYCNIGQYHFDFSSQSSWLKKRGRVIYKGLTKALEEHENDEMKLRNIYEVKVNPNCCVNVPPYSCGMMSTLVEFCQRFNLNTHSSVIYSTSNENKIANVIHKSRYCTVGGFELSPSIIRLLYISKYDSEILSESEIEEIGVIAAEKNAKQNITGVLLACKGFFFQLIEGEPEDIYNLYQKLHYDNRHYELQKLTEQHGIYEHDRLFGNWNMKTVNLEKQNDFYANFMKELIKDASSTQKSIDILLENIKTFKTVIQ
ncbi:hypothetical protein ABK040_015598 [Willaertia magna]